MSLPHVPWAAGTPGMETWNAGQGGKLTAACSTGSDAIIRQHKAACLRITALLACKDLLWIGTSAGVVLTLSVSAKAAPALVGLSQGHTGHVRFLTAIELPDGFEVLFPLPRESGRWDNGGGEPS